MVSATIIGGIGLFVSAAYAALLFGIGKSKKRHAKTWFYVSANASTVALLAFTVLRLVSLFTWPLFWLTTIFLAERAAWTFTLREAAGKDRLMWFLFVLYVPLFGWMLYRVLELR